MSSLKIFTPSGSEPDEGAVTQMRTCMDAAENVGGVLSADHHLGYSMAIGGTIAYVDHVSPSGVGYDIGCGNYAVQTELSYEDISDDLPRIMDQVASEVSFGVGRTSKKSVDHPNMDTIYKGVSAKATPLLKLADEQLGTVGAGNHYVDIFRDVADDSIWVGVHFGSRGFGHKIATGYLNLAQGGSFEGKEIGGNTNSPPVLIPANSSLGAFYIQDMNMAGLYAEAGREVVVNQVLDILGVDSVIDAVHNHHNFAWPEHHHGKDVWVVRKGATPLFPGQRGFVGSSMGEDSVIIRGRMEEMGLYGLVDAYDALWSAPHGAGRQMSRTEAKGKSKKRWTCTNCGWVQGPGEPGIDPKVDRCPKNCRRGTLPHRHIHDAFKRVWVQETKGKVDWGQVQEDLIREKVHLRGGEADEAPGAYKRLPAVLESHKSYVEIQHTLRPIGVAMAGPGTVDPFKDS